MKEIKSKTILNRHKKRDKWFLDDYSINPYSGCAFNCVYCYIRGSKYGQNLAENFAVKINAPELLEKELRRRANRGEYGFILLSSSTDPYPPVEKKLHLTRKLLQIILEYRFPVHIMTKSDLVLRDLDILAEIDTHAILPGDLREKLNHGVIITFSFSNVDNKLSKIFEPGTPPPEKRLDALKKCSERGFFTGAAFIPVLPFISDSRDHLQRALHLIKNAGAHFALTGALTLFGKGPHDSKTVFYATLEKHLPELVSQYKRLFRIFFEPPREYQDALQRTHLELCEALNINGKIV